MAQQQHVLACKEVTRHTSHITRHTSHVTHHTSHVTCYSHRAHDTCAQQPIPKHSLKLTPAPNCHNFPLHNACIQLSQFPTPQRMHSTVTISHCVSHAPGSPHDGRRAEEGEEGGVKHLKRTRWHETRRWHETTCVYMQRTRTSVATCHMAAVATCHMAAVATCHIAAVATCHIAAVATCHITCRHTRTHRLLKRVVVTQYAELAGEGPQHHERHALACARDAQDNLRGV